MSGELREFRRSLPMQLLRAREAVMKEFLPALRAENLTAQQWRVIRALADRGTLDMSAIAEDCYLLLPSVSRIVQNLTSRLLVFRAGASDDQRRSVVRLTATGQELFDRIAPLSEERYDRITQLFGYGKLELLYELMDELVQKLDNQVETDARSTPAELADSL